MRLLTAFALLAALPSMAAAESTSTGPAVPSIEIRDDAPPRVGNASTIVTAGVLESVTVTYSPGSNVAETEIVKALGTDTILWRPSRPGVAEISATGHTAKTVSVRFDDIPMGGIAIMMLAALILFGGAFVSLRALLAND